MYRKPWLQAGADRHRLHPEIRRLQDFNGPFTVRAKGQAIYLAQAIGLGNAAYIHQRRANGPIVWRLRRLHTVQDRLDQKYFLHGITQLAIEFVDNALLVIAPKEFRSQFLQDCLSVAADGLAFVEGAHGDFVNRCTECVVFRVGNSHLAIDLIKLKYSIWRGI